MIDWFTALVPPWFMIGIIAFASILGSIAYLILLERKIASWVQDRIGPNRTGLGFGIVPWLKDKPMFGLGQPMADGLKFFFKEDYKPKNVDKILFTVAPALMMIVMVVSAATHPMGWLAANERTYYDLLRECQTGGSSEFRSEVPFATCPPTPKIIPVVKYVNVDHCRKPRSPTAIHSRPPI